MKASWKTTLGGSLAALAILCGQAATLLDNDPMTNPSFAQIVAAFGMLGLGMAARDESVSSEEAGVK